MICVTSTYTHVHIGRHVITTRIPHIYMTTHIYMTHYTCTTHMHDSLHIHHTYTWLTTHMTHVYMTTHMTHIYMTHYTSTTHIHDISEDTSSLHVHHTYTRHHRVNAQMICVMRPHTHVHIWNTPHYYTYTTHIHDIVVSMHRWFAWCTHIDTCIFEIRIITTRIPHIYMTSLCQCTDDLRNAHTYACADWKTLHHCTYTTHIHDIIVSTQMICVMRAHTHTRVHIEDTSSLHIYYTHGCTHYVNA